MRFTWIENIYLIDWCSGGCISWYRWLFDWLNYWLNKYSPRCLFYSCHVLKSWLDISNVLSYGSIVSSSKMLWTQLCEIKLCDEDLSASTFFFWEIFYPLFYVIIWKDWPGKLHQVLRPVLQQESLEMSLTKFRGIGRLNGFNFSICGINRDVYKLIWISMLIK